MLRFARFLRRLSMLVLSRRCGEQIVIAENIVVTVGAIEGNKVRIGVDAPNSIRVDRKEVHDRRVFELDDVPAFEY
jgi:carbon storage regulator